MLSLTTLSLISSLVLAAAYALYRAALPKPIPGIPYNKHSARRILGDVPDLLAHNAKTSEVFSFLRAQAIKFNEPVVQVFLRPLGRPWVIVSDFRETQDIMVRRSREFDRAAMFGDLFSTVAPDAHVHFPTNDKWKNHRKLLADTMAPNFLINTAAPQMHTSALCLLDLWRHKMRLAEGRPFSIEQDLKHAGLDIIWAATFGDGMSALQAQVDLLSSRKSIPLPKDTNSAVSIEEATPPVEFTAIANLTDLTEMAQASPFPRWSNWFALKFIPKFRNAQAQKTRMIQEGLEKAWAKFSKASDDDGAVKSTMDFILQREAQLAKKEDRAAVWDSPAIKDELLSFLVAGHDTTTTTLAWAMKHLTDNQTAQSTLRSELHAAFPDAESNPPAQAVSKARIPYLDAVIEEVFRLGGTVPAHARNATVDTEILGHFIPKGTDVVCLTNGAGYTMPAFQVDEPIRSASSQASKDKNGVWDNDTIGRFMPERWLTKNEKGEVDFDARAGPVLPFGAGPRGCFGRKLAELELRIVMALIFWNFQLDPIPAELSSYSARDSVTHMPQQCYVRLADAN